jgi:hypothetical protein
VSARQAQHMHETDRHGTPPEVIAIARHALGRIDLDPTSEPAFNAHVGALRFLSEAQDATSTPWFTGAPPPLRAALGPSAPSTHSAEAVLCNPPGGLVKELWYALCSYWVRGWIASAVWVGFNINQLTHLQNTRAAYHPLQLATLHPRRRWAYLAPSGKPAGSPPHGSYLTLLSHDPDVRRAFVEAATPHGYITNA